MRIDGLPFGTANVAGLYGAASIGWVNNISLTAGNVLTAYSLDNNQTLISFQQTPSGGGASASVPLDTSGGVIIQLTYQSI